VTLYGRFEPGRPPPPGRTSAMSADAALPPDWDGSQALDLLSDEFRAVLSALACRIATVAYLAGKAAAGG
jgi:hypothetical protein